MLQIKDQLNLMKIASSTESMTTAAKCKRKHLDEAGLFVEILQIFKPESLVLFQNQSRQILPQVVVGKRIE